MSASTNVFVARLVAIAVVVNVAGCTAASPTAVEAKPPVDPPTAVAPPSLPKTDPGSTIGSATLAADGTINLQLRAEGSGGAVGDALLVYPPTHPDYAKIKKHVEAGGPAMQPGETRPVAPF